MAMSSGGAPDAVLPGEVVEELRGGEGQLTHAALQEIAGERRLGSDDKLRRLGPAADLAEQGAKAV